MQGVHPDPGPTGLTFTSTIHHDTYAAIASIAGASNLKGKTVLITGAANGVGRAIALSAARAGAPHIAIGDIAPLESLDNELHQAAKESGHKDPFVLPLELDITSASSVRAAAIAVDNVFNGLDILVNNAGRFEEYVPLLDSDADSYWSVFELNLHGTINMTRTFLHLLLGTENGAKTVINMSSIGALSTTGGGGGAYKISKLGILRFTEFLHENYAEQDLLAYCVHPGAVATTLGKGLPEHLHGMLVDSVELPGDSVVWLAQERREWLGGRYVSVCWDLPEVVERRDEIVKGDKLRIRMVF